MYTPPGMVTAAAYLGDGTTQCGNYMIFKSFRFYVKSTFEDLEVKLQFCAISGALNFVDLVYFSIQKVKK